MLPFSSLVITALLGAIASNAAPLVQERGMLELRNVLNDVN